MVLAQRRQPQRIGAWLLGRERTSPAGFYMAAFFISYQIATLFDEARLAAGATLAILRHALAGGGAG